MVCGTCQSVFLRKAVVVEDNLSGNPPSTAFVHHKNFKSLRKAAEDDKCILCYNLLARLKLETRDLSLSKSSNPKNGHLTDIRITYKKSDFSRELDIINHDFDSHGTARLSFNIALDKPFYCLYSLRTNKDSPCSKDLCSTNTTISETLPAVLRWLERCCSKHRSCNDDHGREGWNPTRLLDLGFAPDTLRLIDTHPFADAVIYATLSHKWGKTPLIRLDRTSEQHLRTNLRIEGLPLTFQHACQVTRALGIRYLWIDSLCIRQDKDDLSDWRHESSLMNRVYQHGRINISADFANDSTEGMFMNRDSTGAGFADVELRMSNDPNGKVSCKAFDENLWIHSVDDAPLNKRAWVLQERILSKRVLHFSRTQVFWECQELKASESLPDGLPNDGDDFSENLKCFEPHHILSKEQAKKQKITERMLEEQAYAKWYRIVRLYSRCGLTNPGDKLVAIMGVAKHMSTILQDEYVAGMWKRVLVSELSWYVDDPEQKSGRPTLYRAPTWSWASLDAQVLAGFPSHDGIRMRVKDIVLEYATDDTFGPLKGGRIYLEGVLRRIGIQPTWFQDEMRLSSLDGVVLSEDSIYFHVWLDIVPNDNFRFENENGLLFCMEVVVNRLYLQSIMLRCEDEAAGTFSRIGLLNIYGVQREKLLASRERLGDLPCVSWDADNQLHTICVI